MRIKIAFLVIASAGFGAKIDYSDSHDSKDTSVAEMEITSNLSKEMYSFGGSLMISSDRFFVRAATPNFIYPIAKYIRIPFISHVLEETAMGYSSLKSHMENIISQARDAWFTENAKETRTDAPKHKDVGAALLKTLVQSNMNEESGGNRLTDDEMISDVFVSIHQTECHASS